jgi:uncharacterized protein (TIGR03086 family)
MYDLGPATETMTSLLMGVSDAALSDRTPCPDYTLGDLVEHVGGLALAFTGAATKNPLEATPSGDASRLPDGWRDVFASRLAALATAWKAPEAWTGMTRAGGVELPGEVAGRVALNELVVHGWDIARALGEHYHPAPSSVTGALEFVGMFPPTGPERAGLFGDALPVPDGASDLDRLILLTGRDPEWSAHR